MHTQQTDAPADDQLVLRWRRDRLADAGFPLPLATAAGPRRALRPARADRARRARVPARARGADPRSAGRRAGGMSVARPLPSARAGGARTTVASTASRGQAPRSRVARVAPPAALRRRRAGRRRGAAARAAAAGRALRGRAAPAGAPAPARRRPRRHRERGRRRRARLDPGAARHLPRRQPLHHVGVQVRAAGGGGQAAPARLAGTRGAARARDLEPLLRRRARRRASRPSRESCWRPSRAGSRRR